MRGRNAMAHPPGPTLYDVILALSYQLFRVPLCSKGSSQLPDDEFISFPPIIVTPCQELDRTSPDDRHDARSRSSYVPSPQNHLYEIGHFGSGSYSRSRGICAMNSSVGWHLSKRLTLSYQKQRRSAHAASYNNSIRLEARLVPKVRACHSGASSLCN